MLKTENYCIKKENILMHELIGLNAKIVNSSDKKRISTKGKIVNETKKVIVLDTSRGEKIMPKQEIVLEIDLGNEKVIVDGKRILQRPEDRIKTLWRKRNDRM